jgi:hypothetical protein
MESFGLIQPVRNRTQYHACLVKAGKVKLSVEHNEKEAVRKGSI